MSLNTTCAAVNPKPPATPAAAVEAADRRRRLHRWVLRVACMLQRWIARETVSSSFSFSVANRLYVAPAQRRAERTIAARKNGNSGRTGQGTRSTDGPAKQCAGSDPLDRRPRASGAHAGKDCASPAQLNLSGSSVITAEGDTCSVQTTYVTAYNARHDLSATGEASNPQAEYSRRHSARETVRPSAGGGRSNGAARFNGRQLACAAPVRGPTVPQGDSARPTRIAALFSLTGLGRSA